MQKLEPQRISANEKIKHQKKLVTKAEKKKADIEGQASRAEQEVADLEQQLSEIKKTAEKVGPTTRPVKTHCATLTFLHV